jgi:hypothetical protein
MGSAVMRRLAAMIAGDNDENSSLSLIPSDTRLTVTNGERLTFGVEKGG